MKEYNKNYLNKLKNDPRKYKSFKEKERLRIAKFRGEQKLEEKIAQQPYNSKCEEKKRKFKNCLRQKIYREKKKHERSDEAEKNPYKVRQTLFKAVKRAKKNLPLDFKRAKAVVRELLNEFDPEAAKILELRTRMKVKFQEPKEHKKVKDFYARDDISYQCSGKADYIVVRQPEHNTKIKMQKRYLKMAISELYELYKKDAGNREVVGKSTFFELRPAHVKLTEETPHNVCVCQLHANFAYLCSALKAIKCFPESYNILLQEMCCNILDEKCMTDKCSECQKDVHDILPLICDCNNYISWKKWEKTKTPVE